MQPSIFLTSLILVGSTHARRLVYQRANGGPLYGPSGRPSMFDIQQQVGNPDCGFISSLAAVVHASPDWIRVQLTITGTTSDTSAVAIQMYDPSTLKPVTEDVTWSEGTTHGDDHTSAWWPGAYDRAAINLNMTTTNGRLGPINPGDSLSAITGQRGLCTDTSSPDQLFEELQKAQKYDTPLVLVTFPSTKILVDNHAFAVINTSTADGTRMVGLFNPWDSDSYVSSDAVYSDVSYTCNLYKYPSWAGLSSVNPSTIPTSTMTSIGDIAYAIPTPHITAPTTTQKGVADPFEKVVWETVVVTVAV